MRDSHIFISTWRTSLPNLPSLKRPGRKRGFLGYRGFYFSNFYLDLKNPRFSNIRVFDIHLSDEYRKHGCLKISDFLKSQFWLFTRQMFENPRFSNIGVFDIHYRRISKTRMSENLGFFEIPVLDRCLKIRDFLTSVFSIFTIGEYRQHGFSKVSDF